MGLSSTDIDSLDHVETLYWLTNGEVNSNNISIKSYWYHCSFEKLAYFNGTYYRFDNLSTLQDVQYYCSASARVTDALLWLSIILGIPGNVIALITILTMPQTTSTFYIALLSLSDLIALISRAGYKVLIHYNVYFTKELCQFMLFLTNFSATYANWVLVFICFERFITIQFPLKKTFIFTIKRARYSGLVLALSIFPIGLTYVFLTNCKNGICVENESLTDFHTNVFSHIEATLYFFAPVLLLFLFTILVTLALRKHTKIHKSLMGNGSSGEQNLQLTVSNEGQEGDHIQSQRLNMAGTGKAKATIRTGTRGFKSSTNGRRDEAEALGRSITIMMIFTSVVFVVLTIPLCIHYLYMLPMKDTTTTNVTYAKNALFSTVVFYVSLLSHAVNFYIYFVSAKKFRSQFYWLFVKRGAFEFCHHKHGILSFNSKTTHI